MILRRHKMKLLRIHEAVLIRVIALKLTSWLLSERVVLKGRTKLKVLFNGIGIVEVRIAVRTAYIRDLNTSSALKMAPIEA